MANAGRILIIPKGEWSADETYEMLDLVTHEGVTWLAKKCSCGLEPSEETSEYWFNILGTKHMGLHIANDLATTEEGYALDARQGKVLMDALELTSTEVSGIASQLEELKTTLFGTSTSFGDIELSIESVEASIETIGNTIETMQNNANIIRGTLGVGATSIVLTDARMTTNSMLSFYTSVWGVNPTSATVVDGQVTLGFDAQTVAVEVGVRIDG